MSERGDTQTGERPDGWDGVVRSDPVAPAAKPVPAIVADAADLKALRSAVVDAASVGAGLWVSYLFALFYLLVAAGAVTHRDLFFESPVRLPFLGVDLPLKGFFILGPALFLIVHAYVLLHFAMLSGKVRAFDVALREQIEDAGVRTDLRRQLPSNIFVQYLAGPGEIRNGFMGFCLWLIALISLVVGPVLLLMFFELQFLPYHHQGITWWQRIAVGIDLGLMWLFWRRIALLDGRTDTPDGGNRPMAVAERVLTAGAMWGPTGVAGLMMLVFATFPGEPIDTLWWKSSEQMSAWMSGRLPLFARFPGERIDPRWAELAESPAPSPFGGVRAALIAGEVNPASRVPESVWSNRLVLPGLNVVTHLKLDSEDKIAFLPETVSLRERNLDAAVLSGAVLRKADFTGASMKGALLEGVDLRQARLTCTDWDGGGRDPICTQLQGASLYNAQLQGASLDGAQLQGAWLNIAQLQGASLNEAQLQGASLNSAQLQGASLRSVFAWRADALTSDTRNSWIDAVRPHRSEACGDRASNYTCDFTTESFQKLRAAVAAAIPEERRRDSVLRTIDERLDPSPDKQLARDEMLATWWSSRNTLRAAWADHEAEMAKHWLAAACAPEGAPHVVSALVARLLAGANPFSDDSPHPADLARDFLSDTCEGAKGLSDDDKARLRRFAATDRAKPTPPPRPPPP